MPKIETYQAINNPNRIFHGRADYLDYLRARQRERLSWARRCVGREKALARLHQVRLLNSWAEVQDFINDHARDIDLVSGSDNQFCDFSLTVNGGAMTKLDFRCHPVGMKLGYGDEPPGARMAFTGHFQHRYRREAAPSGREKAKRERRGYWRLRERYDFEHHPYLIHGHTDVLSEIGIIAGGGGGGGLYRYSMVAFHEDWDHLRVMERLAA